MQVTGGMPGSGCASGAMDDDGPQVCGLGVTLQWCFGRSMCHQPTTLPRRRALRPLDVLHGVGQAQDKTRITPAPASQADEVSDLILIRPRLAHA